MGKKKPNRAISLQKSGYEMFWVVTLSNGNCSPSLPNIVSCNNWILDHVDEKTVSHILIRRCWRNPNAKINQTLFNKTRKREETKEKRAAILAAQQAKKIAKRLREKLTRPA